MAVFGPPADIRNVSYRQHSIETQLAKPVFGNTTLSYSAGRHDNNSAYRSVPILQASGDALSALLLKTVPALDHAIVVAFPRFARALHASAKYRNELPTRDLAHETIAAIGIAGEDNCVRSLTGYLKLLR